MEENMVGAYIITYILFFNYIIFRLFGCRANLIGTVVSVLVN